MTQSALLDGGTIHAAGAAFQRLSSRLSIRPINILALFSLIDSYVLFERLVVPETNWKYFQSFAPPDWVNYLEDVVEPVEIQFDIKRPQIVSRPCICFLASAGDAAYR